MDNHRPEAFIFMKVKDYEDETLEEIVKRKQDELDDVGKTFWGYGGTILDPKKQVQPFVGRWFRKQDPIYLLMERKEGKFKSEASPGQGQPILRRQGRQEKLERSPIRNLSPTLKVRLGARRDDRANITPRT